MLHKLQPAPEITDTVHRHVIESIPDAALIHAANIVLIANQAAAELFGARDALDLQGRNIRDLLHPDDQQEIESNWAAQGTPDEKLRVNVRRRRIDGSIFHGESTHAPYQWGVTPALLVVIRDVTERLELERNQIEGEQNYRLLAEANPNAVFVHSDNIIIYVNPAAVHMFGAADAEELIGQDIMSLVHPEDRKRMVDKRPSMHFHKPVPLGHVRRLRLDETDFLTDGTGTAVTWAGRRAIMVSTYDITERVAAETALSESEARYRALAEMSPFAMFVRHEGRFVYANPACVHLVGANSVDDLIGLDSFHFVIEEDLEQARDVAARIDAGEGGVIGFSSNIRRRRLDGSTFVADTSGIALEWQGQPATLITLQDMTDRHEAELQLRAREARLSAVIGTAVNGVATIDTQGIVQSFNPAAEKLFGYEAGEVIGRNVKMLMPHEYADHHDDFIANYRRTGEARIIGTGREVTAMRKDGSTFPIDLAVGESQEGDNTFFVGIIRDITERKEAEQAIARSEARYRTITETCPDAILIHVEGRLRFANTAAAHMFGAASPDELTGKHIVDDLTHPDDRGTLESYREQILRGEKVERVPIRRLRLDGSTFDSVGAGALTEYDGEQAVVFIFFEIETQPRDPGWSV